MDVVMPQLGETVAEGLVGAWHKKEGDQVAKNEVLLDIETDKVSTEIEAPISGTLAKIVVEEGETVDVGTLLAVIQGEGEELEINELAIETIADPSPESPEHASPLRRDTEVRDRARLSPAVRRALKKYGVEAGDITGTGRNGRITLQDVEAFQSRAPEKEVLPFSTIRSRIAEHMVRSKATSPHVLQAIEVDFSGVAEARRTSIDQWRSERGYSLTYLPFVASAVCQAIAGFPRINASVVGKGLKIHDAINLAIAVDLGEEGLITPVVKNAQEFSITEIAQAIHELVTRAKNKQLQPDDMTQGTYTISNSGSFGTLITAPIINQPQVAILSLDGIHKRPTVIESSAGDEIEIRPIGILAQSFDHRAFDGAYSAGFLKKLKETIEGSDWVARLDER